MLRCRIPERAFLLSFTATPTEPDPHRRVDVFCPLSPGIISKVIGKWVCDEGSTINLMVYIHAVLAGHLEWVLYALSLSISALPDVLLALQRRGLGRGGFGGFGRRRSRRGGLLGGLALFFLLGPILVVVIIAYFVLSLFSRMRRGR